MGSLFNTRIKFFILTLLSGIVLAGLCQMADAREREFHHRQFFDSRFHHDHFYPPRGLHIDVLPPGHRLVVFGRARFYFFEGVWYRPFGRRFVVVAPPIGLFVPFLPTYYTTITVAGVPYYYANEVYYTAAPGGYQVVVPPTGEVIQVPSSEVLSPPGSSPLPSAGGPMPGEQIFIYPRQGQNEKKQADDRYECHRWAVSQTNFDPTKTPDNVPEAQKFQKNADYKRALGACLDGRGYTVK